MMMIKLPKIKKGYSFELVYNELKPNVVYCLKYPDEIGYFNFGIEPKETFISCSKSFRFDEYGKRLDIDFGDNSWDVVRPFIIRDEKGNVVNKDNLYNDDE
jgi:hypothetical protein